MVLQKFRVKLISFRKRHLNTDLEIGQCCKAMKERIAASEECERVKKFSRMTTALDRFFTSRISIHMITNYHLKLFANDRVQFNDVGLIRPNCDIRSVLSDAVAEVTTYVEGVYMAAPKVDIQIYKKAKEITEPVTGDSVPQHLSIIFKEVLENSMRATVEHHFHDLENLPPVLGVICQAGDEFTIKISDCGGGMDRKSAGQCFLLNTARRPSTRTRRTTATGCPWPGSTPGISMAISRWLPMR